MNSLAKEASIADALLGAPIGAIAAAISAKKGEKKKAVSRGLVLGALLGFIQGQRTAAVYQQDPEHTERVLSPAIVSLLAGLGAGMYSRRKDIFGRLLDRKRD